MQSCNADLFSGSVQRDNQLVSGSKNVWCVLGARGGVSYGGISVMNAKQHYTEFRHCETRALTAQIKLGDLQIYPEGKWHELFGCYTAKAMLYHYLLCEKYGERLYWH